MGRTCNAERGERCLGHQRPCPTQPLAPAPSPSRTEVRANAGLRACPLRAWTSMRSRSRTAGVAAVAAGGCAVRRGRAGVARDAACARGGVHRIVERRGLGAACLCGLLDKTHRPDDDPCKHDDCHHGGHDDTGTPPVGWLGWLAACSTNPCEGGAWAHNGQGQPQSMCVYSATQARHVQPRESGAPAPC